MASILNHSAHTDLQNPGLQNHEERPATGTGSQTGEGTPDQNSSSDSANTPIQDALVANVGHLLLFISGFDHYCFLTALVRLSDYLRGNRVVRILVVLTNTNITSANIL